MVCLTPVLLYPPTRSHPMSIWACSYAHMGMWVCAYAHIGPFFCDYRTKHKAKQNHMLPRAYGYDPGCICVCSRAHMGMLPEAHMGMLPEAPSMHLRAYGCAPGGIKYACMLSRVCMYAVPSIHVCGPEYACMRSRVRMYAPQTMHLCTF